MKRSMFVVVILLMASFLLISVVIAQETGKMETATGKITALDPGGKGIVIDQNIGGKEPLVVGTIVDKDTVVKIKGKTAGLNDLKVGDTVTIRYLRSTDLYAKEITKK